MNKLTPIQYQKLAPERADYVLNVDGIRYFAFYEKDHYVIVSKSGRRTGQKVYPSDRNWFVVLPLGKKLNRSFASGNGVKG